MPRHTRSRIFWPGAGFLLTLVALIVCCANLIGCASTNPIGAAADLDQRAYATYGSFVIAEEQAAQLLQSQNPMAALTEAGKAIQRADAKAKPTADALVQAIRDYDAAVKSLPAGATTSDTLTAANTHLTQWLATAQTDFQALIAALHSAP